LAAAGGDVVAMPASVARPVPVETEPTLARGRLRIPFRLIGNRRAFRLHDRIVAGRLEKFASQISIVHVWPSGALETLREAKRLGIPSAMERPNARTRYAYEIVNAECERIGVRLPHEDDYTYRNDVLAQEEEEFRLSDFLLCPSDFAAKTLLDRVSLRKRSSGTHTDMTKLASGRIPRRADQSLLSCSLAGSGTQGIAYRVGGMETINSDARRSVHDRR